MSLDQAIDGFFLEFREFVKRVEDEVASLKRNLDHGYSLGPHQLRDRIKEVQRQLQGVVAATTELENHKRNGVSLTEFSQTCLLAYQSVANGIEVLEAHLRNYGYLDDGFEKAPHNPMTLLNPIPTQAPRNSLCSTPPPKSHQVVGRSSLGSFEAGVSKTPAPLTHYTYSALEPQQCDTVTKPEPRRSYGSFSTLSHDAFHCSPGTLALKQKYAAVESDPALQTELDQNDGFEFKPHWQLEDGQMEIDVVPETRSQSPLLSPRLSFTPEQARFGSPFRSPHKKAEKSVFNSPAQKAPSWIPEDLYETLPQYLRSAVPLTRLDVALQTLCTAPSFTPDTFLTQEALEGSEGLGNKFVVQAFVKLGVLERQFRNGSMGYQLSTKWAHLA